MRISVTNIGISIFFKVSYRSQKLQYCDSTKMELGKCTQMFKIALCIIHTHIVYSLFYLIAFQEAHHYTSGNTVLINLSTVVCQEEMFIRQNRCIVLLTVQLNVLRKVLKATVIASLCYSHWKWKVKLSTADYKAALLY